jgi:hypothetical protein
MGDLCSRGSFNVVVRWRGWERLAMLVQAGKPWASDTIHPHSIQKDDHFSFRIGSKLIRLVFETLYVVERIQRSKARHC